jgi:hypothetical protein
MIKLKTVITMAALFALSATIAHANSQNMSEAEGKVCGALGNIYQLMLFTAGGIGAIVIVLQGLMWVSSAEEAKVRKSAKLGIIHALIGLIIVSLAPVIVAILMPDSSSCIGAWPGFPGNGT